MFSELLLSTCLCVEVGQFEFSQLVLAVLEIVPKPHSWANTVE